MEREVRGSNMKREAKENRKDKTSIFSILSAQFRPFTVRGRREERGIYREHWGADELRMECKERGNTKKMRAIYTGSNVAIRAAILVE